jgi:regulatory protein
MATGSAGGRSRSRGAGTPLSLKGRGLALLAQRDHSRVELKRKLMPHARGLVLAESAAVAVAEAEAEAEAQIAAPSVLAPESAPVPSAADRVNEVLDWLQARDYLSDSRFAESRTHARSAKFGNLRIRQELSQHGVALTPEFAQRLKETEFERARELHSRKFGRPPSTVAEHAKQSRFLAGRGFSTDAIRQVMRLVGWAPIAEDVADGDED